MSHSSSFVAPTHLLSSDHHHSPLDSPLFDDTAITGEFIDRETHHMPKPDYLQRLRDRPIDVTARENSINWILMVGREGYSRNIHDKIFFFFFAFISSPEAMQIHLGGEDFIDRPIDTMVGEDLFERCLQRVHEFLNDVDLEGVDVNHLILIHLGGEDFIDRPIDSMVAENLFEGCLQKVNEFINEVKIYIHRLIDLMVGKDLFEGCLQKVNKFLNEVDLEGADVNHLILVDNFGRSIFINYLSPDVRIVKELPKELQPLDLEAIGSVEFVSGIPSLLEDGIKVLVYAGKDDLICIGLGGFMPSSGLIKKKFESAPTHYGSTKSISDVEKLDARKTNYNT
ncbi:cyclin-D2-1 isoform X1 [Senna tora]|uniref:Cyclin-D2-1 isoform X1 n=1 Tax=Senna tora TaxID=362788 RepID=A0A834SVB7_9FABA|nr:cyclin-D2-1 isoform X1 [Senna tora]